MNDMQGKNALITAGSRGTGRAIGEALAARGSAVAVNYRENELLTEEFRHVAAGMSPFNRIGEPEEVAAGVSFVASPAAGWVTG